VTEVDRWTSPDVPEPARLAAAKGSVPLPPHALVTVVARLLADPSPRVREAAQGAWTELPAKVIGAALESRELSGEVLERLAGRGDLPRPLVLRLLQHPGLTPAAASRFASSPDPEIAAQLARNHRLLLQAPGLAREVLRNPSLPAEERSRLESLAAEQWNEEPEQEPSGAGGSEETEAELPPALPPVLVDDQAAPPAAEPERENLYRMVRSLTVAQKIRLAMLGSKAARRLLVRDTNKAVVRAVVQSPKIREDEVLAIAQDRTVAEEVIRLILQRRDWVKNYSIRAALCQNPKTPLPKALRLLETLQERDLRQIAKSRNVPSAISAGATRVLARRRKL